MYDTCKKCSHAGTYDVCVCMVYLYVGGGVSVCVCVLDSKGKVEVSYDKVLLFFFLR